MCLNVTICIQERWCRINIVNYKSKDFTNATEKNSEFSTQDMNEEVFSETLRKYNQNQRLIWNISTLARYYIV